MARTNQGDHRMGNTTHAESEYPAGRNVIGKFSWSDMLERLDAEPPADMKSSRKRGDSDFNGLSSWSEAVKAAREGYPAARERMTRSLAAVLPAVGGVARPHDRLDVAGERPVVAIAATGDPRCMVRRGPAMRRMRPIVRIENNIGAPWFISASALENRGAAIVAWAMAAESAGYSTEIVNVWGSKYDGSLCRLSWTVKEAGESFDLDRLSFAIGSADFMRRVGFHTMEQLKVRSPWKGCYGIPCETYKWDSDIPPGIAYFGVVTEAAPWETPARAADSARRIIEAAFPSLQASP